MTEEAREGPFAVAMDAFPLVRMSSPHFAQYQRPSAASFFECIERAIGRDEPCVILLDARNVPHADEIRRRAFMHHLEARRPRIERVVVAFAAVCGSPLERGMITALMWFVRLPLPIRIFTHEAEAKAWLLGRYEAARANAARAGAVQSILRGAVN